MFLAIDIGNTHTVAAVYDGPALRADWRMVTIDHMTDDAIGPAFTTRLSALSIAADAISSIGISSVVPAATDIYANIASSLFRVRPTIIDGSLDLGIAIRYEDPMAVGADRLCNAVAGYAKYGGPLIIVDFGTATTYDIVASNGDYLGGVIAPGVETSAADLHRRAARLPRVELTLPASLIAKDTVSSMQAGILYGALDATEGMVRRLKDVLRVSEGADPTIIGTGGFSQFVFDHSKALQYLEPNLVLDGVRIICERLGKA